MSVIFYFKLEMESYVRIGGRVLKILHTHTRGVKNFQNQPYINTFKYHVFAPMGRFQLESPHAPTR